jgi:hypothetical protein
MAHRPPSRVGELVRRHRIAAALSQEALAEQAGLSGRPIDWPLDEVYRDRGRAYQATEPYAIAMRKRRVWVATQRIPGFAEAKDWHGLRRFRLRGLEQVNGETRLIAAGQNLKRLLSQRGWGQRPFPSGATGVVLPALLPLAGVLP